MLHISQISTTDVRRRRWLVSGLVIALTALLIELHVGVCIGSICALHVLRGNPLVVRVRVIPPERGEEEAG